MKWNLIIPSNFGCERKTRLAPLMSAEEREILADAMFAHVVEQARGCSEIGEIVVLSPYAPPDDDLDWTGDMGAGLNAEIGRTATGFSSRPLLVVHADLPLLGTADLDALIDAATGTGVAIAPDRHGTGTNALAFTNATQLSPSFGPDSLALHRKAYPNAAICERPGLAFDLDGPDDLQALKKEQLPPLIAGTIKNSMC